MVAAVLDGRIDPEELVDETGNVPAAALYAGFFMQAPTAEIAHYATLLENLWNDEFVEAWQAMAQWSREQVPFPGAALRQIVADLVRHNVLMTGRMQLNGREIDFANVRGNVLNAVAERDKVVPLRRGRAGKPARRRSRPPRRAPAQRRPRHVLRRTLRGPAHASGPDDLARRAQRRARPSEGALMDIRRLDAQDQAALERFVEQIPEGDRTFFKEDVTTPRWLPPGRTAARRVSIAVDGRRGGRLSRRHSVAGLVESRRRGAGDRRTGPPWARHRARPRPARRPRGAEHRPAEDGGRGRRRPGADNRDVPLARLRTRGAAHRPCPRPGRRAPRPDGARALGRRVVRRFAAVGLARRPDEHGAEQARRRAPRRRRPPRGRREPRRRTSRSATATGSSRTHELDERSNRLAQALLAAGVGKGSRVAYLDRTAPEVVELLFATSKLGAVTVPLNWRLAPTELAAVLDDARARPC